MNEWQENTGVMPVGKDSIVDVMWRSGNIHPCERASNWDWALGKSSIGVISKWRLHKTETLIGNKDCTSLTANENPKQQHGQSSLPLNLFSPLGTAYGCLGKLNGKLKYGLNNFVATPVIASIYVDAIRRHLDKWMCGQEVDDADGVPHFAAILANVDILLCARAAGTLIDDRPMSINYFEEIEKLTPIVKALTELHNDKSPHHYTIADNKDGTIKT